MLRIELSEQMMIIVFDALAGLPYRTSAPVIVELQRQVDEQMEQRKKQNVTSMPDAKRG